MIFYSICVWRDEYENTHRQICTYYFYIYGVGVLKIVPIIPNVHIYGAKSFQRPFHILPIWRSILPKIVAAIWVELVEAKKMRVGVVVGRTASNPTHPASRLPRSPFWNLSRERKKIGDGKFEI